MMARQTVATQEKEALQQKDPMLMPDPLLELGEDDNAAVTVVLRSDVLGDDDQALGDLLLKELFASFCNWESPPEKILFYHRAVRLTLAGSSVLSSLKQLQEKGTMLWVCATSLRHLTYKDPQVGSQAPFGELVDEMKRARKVLWF